MFFKFTVLSKVRYSVQLWITLDGFLSDYNHPLKKIVRPLLFNTVGKANVEKLVSYINRKNALTMKPETKKYLIDYFRDDILKLQDLLGRDLTHWLEY